MFLPGKNKITQRSFRYKTCSSFIWSSVLSFLENKDQIRRCPQRKILPSQSLLMIMSLFIQEQVKYTGSSRKTRMTFSMVLTGNQSFTGIPAEVVEPGQGRCKHQQFQENHSLTQKTGCATAKMSLACSAPMVSHPTPQIGVFSYNLHSDV